MRGTFLRRTSALVLISCLLVGACAAADDDTTASDTTTAATATTASASDSSTGETDAPATDSAVATTVEVTGELGRGVTDDTIKLGVLYLDLEKIKDILPNLNQGNFETAFQDIATSINEAGGVNGRKLELVFGAVDVLDMSQAVNQCVRLIEDEQVFAIVAAGSTKQSTQCTLTDHATPMIGGTQTPATLAAAEAPWFSPVLGSANSTRKLVEVLVDRGTLEGRKLAIVANADDKPVAEEAKATLEAAGVEVTTVAISSDFGDDEAAARAELQTFIGRMRSDGRRHLAPGQRRCRPGLPGGRQDRLATEAADGRHQCRARLSRRRWRHLDPRRDDGDRLATGVPRLHRGAGAGLA